MHTPLLIFQKIILLQELAPFLEKNKKVAGRLRASPSASLDKKETIWLTI